jgi:hypothetical protein
MGDLIIIRVPSGCAFCASGSRELGFGYPVSNNLKNCLRQGKRGMVEVGMMPESRRLPVVITQ